MSARFAAVLMLGAIFLQGDKTAAHEAELSPLPDRLQSGESADFALAAERAELEPGYRKRGLGLDFQGAQPNSHFYSWTVIPSWGEGFVYFVVDRRTGDVWAYLGCELVRSPELTSLQARFRRRFNVPMWRVRRIEGQGFPNEDC